MVVRLDLEDFFAAVTAARVFGIFRTAGYPESVAHTLTGLCTNVVPAHESVSGHYRLARRLATPHLPQGAPTSPALANLAAFGLDRRLSGLAAAIGARYSRYADDLVLSSDHHLRTPVAMIGEIAAAEGFRLNAAKTRVMGRGTRQTVTGVVVNARPNVPRADYDELKAILHRASLHGPAGLDPAHLLGRIAWVEALNPSRGAKLRAAFTSIGWVRPLQFFWLYSVDRNIEGSDPSMSRLRSRWARAAKPRAPRAVAASATAVAMRTASARSPETCAVQARARPSSSPTPRPGALSSWATTARACAASPACAATWAMPASAAGRIRTGSELRSRTELSRNQRSARSRSPRESQTWPSWSAVTAAPCGSVAAA